MLPFHIEKVNLFTTWYRKFHELLYVQALEVRNILSNEVKQRNGLAEPMINYAIICSNPSAMPVKGVYLREE